MRSVIDEVVMVLAELGNNITTLNQFKDLKWDDLTLPEPWMGIELYMCARCLYLFMFWHVQLCIRPWFAERSGA